MTGGLLNNCHFSNLGANVGGGRAVRMWLEGERGLEVKGSMALFIRARSKKTDGWASLSLTKELNICKREPQAIAGRRGD